MSAQRRPRRQWEVVSLLRKPGEPKARCVVHRIVWKDGTPQSEYLRDAQGKLQTFGSSDLARAAIARLGGAL